MRLRAFLTNKDVWALTALLMLAVMLPVSFGRSEAAFVAGSSNPGSVFNSASSFNTVSVSLTNPGTPLRGTIILNAVATSSLTMSNVVFQTSPAGTNTWTTRCTDNSSPYSCTFNTTGVTDGLYDIRAVATDTAGYSQTSTVTGRRIDNTAPGGTTLDPGSPLTGTVNVSAVGTDAGSGPASGTIQYRPSGGGSWTDICTQSSASVTCSWNTAALADGLYDLRTNVTDLAGNTGTTAIVSSRRLDNIAPSATMTAPAANLTGSVTLASTSADAANGTGVASVRYEYKLSSGSTWNTACTAATTPFSCSFNTTTATDGLYDFRAVATDGVGKAGTSAAVSSIRIDNTAPTATMGTLATNLSGSVSLTSTPADGGSGVASVLYQYKLTTASTWTDSCSSATSPYSCSLNTATLADGLYDFRAVATDKVGITGASAAVTRRVDNTNPTVTMGSLAAWLDGSVSLTSTPADAGGIASVQYQFKLTSASTWTNTCTSGTSPFTCSLDTTALTNGSSYDFQVIATDNAGRTGTSATVTSRIDHLNPTITLTAPAANLAGSVTLASTPADAGSGVASVTYQYKLNSSGPTGTWTTTACSSSSSPFSCSFNTTTATDGLYDFRAIATDNVGRTTTSAAVAAIRIDNTNPITSTLAAVGTNLTGTVNFTGTAADNVGGSGVGSWKVQYSPTGTNTWTDLCSNTTASCSASVNPVADGVYDFRAVVTDKAGNTLASTAQTNRRIDTAGPVTSVASPTNGTHVSGSVTMTANAVDPAGVTNVDFQVFYGGVWFTFCSDNTPSYTCTGDSTAVGDGTYQTRVVATDGLGHQTISSTITLIIDNTHPSASAIQGTNVGTAGTMNQNDRLTFTYSEAMDPASIVAGWNGSLLSTGITARVTNNGTQDTLEVYNGATETGLTGSVNLRSDYVSNNVVFNASIQQTSATTFVLTLGTVSSGAANIRTNVAAANMIWTPSTAAKDLAGNTANVTTVTEVDGDRDF